MIKKRRFGILILLAAVALSAGQAAATVDNVLLPHSSHYEGQTHFYYGGAAGRIEFAVYDTETNPDEFVGADGFDREGDEDYRYIYAYQIFCDATNTNVIDYFGVVGIGENAIEDFSEDIGSVNDETDGQDAEMAYFGSSIEHGQMGIWEFGNGHLAASEHSWFLVLRSNHDWTAGKYTFNENLADTAPIPNPEPATVVLLGLGSVVLVATRKK